jgi:hypothetical protein
MLRSWYIGARLFTLYWYRFCSICLSVSYFVLYDLKICNFNDRISSCSLIWSRKYDFLGFMSNFLVSDIIRECLCSSHPFTTEMKVALRSPTTSGTLSLFWHGYIASSYWLLSLFSFHLLCKCSHRLVCSASQPYSLQQYLVISIQLLTYLKHLLEIDSNIINPLKTEFLLNII